MTLFLSGLTVSLAPSAGALKALIDPEERGRAADAHHRLIWSAFADDPDRRRDFLWRAEGEGRFHVLSRRPPAPSPFFEPPEIQDFAPDLRPGDRLDVILRANATRTRKTMQGGREKRVHDDVVMHAPRDLPPGTARSDARDVVAAEAGAGPKGRAPATASPPNGPESSPAPSGPFPGAPGAAPGSRISACSTSPEPSASTTPWPSSPASPPGSAGPRPLAAG